MKLRKTYCKIFIFPFIALFTMDAVAGETPSPQQIYNTVSNHWLEKEISQLDNYIENLYTTHPEYLPAILAASFRDYIYLGKLSDAKQKLLAVHQLVNSNEDNFETNFKNLLSQQISSLKSEIDMHARHNTTPEMLESNADAQVVRNTWGTKILPGMKLLLYAPETNIVNN